MALTWDDDEQAYRDDETGELIAVLVLIALRNQFADATAERARSLTDDFISGVITFAVWQSAMIALIRSSTIAGYALAVGGVIRLTAEMVKQVATLVGKHLGYFKQFVGEIASNTMTAEAIAERAMLYADAGVEAFEKGQATRIGLFLPTTPPAHPRCRCWIMYSSDDKGPYVAWITSADERVCSICNGIEAKYGTGNPYRGEKETAA